MQVSGQAMEGGVSTCGRVAILLATYNGEKYLDEQMCSLFAQSYSDFVVIARDDSSSDDTRQILERWQTANPGMVSGVSEDKGFLGVNGSFSLLMAFCDAAYLKKEHAPESVSAEALLVQSRQDELV